MKLRAWLAIAAIALNALWPLIAQARPATLVPVCTVGGETHYIEIPAGGTPSTHEHCSLCVVGAALPMQDVVERLAAFSFAVPTIPSFQPNVISSVEADARAPPVFPSVHSNNDNGRIRETAFALRAARPDVGGGIMRVGILLG